MRLGMNLIRLGCALVIISFSMTLFAATPGQLDSFDNIGAGGTNWVETTGAGNGSYMQQDATVVTEGTGSMKFDFTLFVFPDKNDEAIRTFSPALDFTNYKDLAITLWVWTDDPNDARRLTLSSRLNEIIMHDGMARVGRLRVSPS